MKRILVINPFGIGDALFTMTLVEAIRSRYPDSFIGFLCNERTIGLVRMDASIDRSFIFHRDRFRKLWNKHPFLFYRKLKALLSAIRESNFDTLFDLSLGREYSFFGWFVGIRKRIGFDYKGRGLFLTHRVTMGGYEEKPVIDTQLELLQFLDHPKPESPLRPNLRITEPSIRSMDAWLRQGGIQENDRILTIVPGGGRSWGKDAFYKQWDKDRFAAVSKSLASIAPHKVCLVGDGEEKTLLSEIRDLLGGRAVVLAGQSLPEVSALLKRSWLVLGNDGGIMHLANALGSRTVTLFGPVNEGVYAPYFDRPSNRVVKVDVSCRPCYTKFHFPPCPHHRRCLEEITVETVVAAIKEIT